MLRNVPDAGGRGAALCSTQRGEDCAGMFLESGTSSRDAGGTTAAPHASLHVFCIHFHVFVFICMEFLRNAPATCN